MKALIVNSQVLAVGAADVNDTAVLIGGVVYPLSVIGGYELADAASGVQPGWGYSGGEFVPPPPPPPPVPQEITMRQARLVLLGAGLLSGVQAAIDGLPEPQRSAANIEWEFSNTLQRRNPFVLTLGPALGLSAEQIDALFIQGAAL